MARSTIRGLTAFNASIDDVVRSADREIDRANQDAAEIVQRHVVPRVPVDTGQTRDAFASPRAVGRSRKNEGGWRFGLLTPALQKKGYKARWIEFGTKGDSHGHPHAARPFFRPGVEAARDEIRARWRDAVKRAAKLR